MGQIALICRLALRDLRRRPAQAVGIPAGTALYGAVQNGGPQGSPSIWWLLAMVAALMLGVAALTAIPARIGALRSVAAILQAETP